MLLSLILKNKIKSH